MSTLVDIIQTRQLRHIIHIHGDNWKKIYIIIISGIRNLFIGARQNKANKQILEGNMLRKLGIFERALYLSDLHAPFNVISVLRLTNPPDPGVVHANLQKLCERHPLLRAVIRDGQFEEGQHKDITLKVLERKSDSQWLSAVEHEMNTRLDPTDRLVRYVYLYSPERGDLLLTFHHAIIDAASGISLLNELLSACDSPKEMPALEVFPPLEERFPPTHQGAHRILATLRYAAAQMGDELVYWWRVRGKQVPAVSLGGRGFASTITISEEIVDKLAHRCRQQKITLNSLLNAAQLLAVNIHLYQRERLPMRTFTFADLRPYCHPPVSPEHIANYISMLRFTLDVSGNSNVWEIAKVLHEKIYPALKSGDKFTAAIMSEPLMKMFIKVKTVRMGSTGLNYSGSVPLAPSYGDIRVDGLHGFLSSYDIGPEVSSQARLFKNSLWWDFMFLDSDMDRERAETIVNEIMAILLETSKS